MRIFLFEHVCGGGTLGGPLPPLLDEGRAMLGAVASDLLALGTEIVTVRDARVELGFEGAAVATVRDGVQLRAAFTKAALRADAALVIAPESDGVLRGWSHRLAELRVRSLGCSDQAVSLCADKLMLARLLERAGIATPPTSAWRHNQSLESPCHHPGSPLIAKPRHGAGCDDTFAVENPSDLASLPTRGDWIIQGRAVGVAASASFLVHDNEPRRLRAGAQRIEEVACAPGLAHLRYTGGKLPLPQDLERRALALGERAIRAVPGLHGYVGVDLVLRPDEPSRDTVIEINPRLTTSYVGLRRMCTTNLAAAMLDPAAPIRWRDANLTFNPEGRCTWEPMPAIHAAH